MSNTPSSNQQDHEDNCNSNAPLQHTSATETNVSPHSYLPGISNSLFVSKDAVFLKHPCITITSPASATATATATTLPILQLPGVVVFPGMSLPLRLSQRAWIQYVTQSIRAGKTVRIGVVTHLGPSQSQRSSWMRRASRQFHPLVLGSDIMDDSTLDDVVTTNTSRAVTARHRADADKDPLASRVGTIVTVAYTHGDGDTSDELIVTALGTGRCMLLEQLVSPPGPQPMTMYRVHEFNDKECKRPPIQRPICSVPPLPMTSSSSSTTSTTTSTTTTTTTNSRDDAIMTSLSRMTPIPTHCYRMVWPWRLVQEIQLVLDRIPNNVLLLPRSCTVEPMAFSFHLASNLALSERDKLHILQLHDTVQRLQFLLTKVLEQEQNQTYLCCAQCQRKLAHANDMFTVFGSEGTSGAYVNAHGVIHQTITVRDLYQPAIWCSGASETIDSWFPGYAWTIAHCSSCYSHLGWRFDRVHHLDNDDGDDGPERFWGLSGASVTTRVCAINERE